MNALTYAGIGARATPPSVLTAMTVMAGWLARQGWHLNSRRRGRGRQCVCSDGAPAGQRTLYLPWSGYNGCAGPDCRVLSPSELEPCMDIAARLHPAWDRCSPAVRKLHARNAAIVGVGLGRPVNAVVPWTPGGTVTGGTGMAIRMAMAAGIPVLNLGAMTPRAVCERLLAIRRSRSSP